MNKTACLIFLIASSLLFASDENRCPKRCVPNFSFLMFFKKSCNKKIVPTIKEDISNQTREEDINNQILNAIKNDDCLTAYTLIQQNYSERFLDKDFVNKVEPVLTNTANTSMSTKNIRALMKIVDEKTPKI